MGSIFRQFALIMLLLVAEGAVMAPGAEAATDTWSPAGALATARRSHSATLLPSGELLVVGGLDSSNTPLASAELYDPASDTWSAAGSLATARFLHSATLLPTGKVLVVGGSGGGLLASAELYDPSSDTWSAAGSLATARLLHTATLLPSGNLLVVGGRGSTNVPLASAEIYDPGSDTWSAVDALAIERYHHTATLLPSGNLLVVGGYGSTNASLASAEIYDPASDTWSAASALATARDHHTATLLPSGKVLVVGGNFSVVESLASAELYDPVSGTWSAASSLANKHTYHTATLLPSGQVLIAGGSRYGGSLGLAELYDPASDAWIAAGSLATVHKLHTASLLPSGKVLVVGGYFNGGDLASAEIYDPASTSWSQTASLVTARSFHTATLLPSGQVLVAGGSGAGLLASAELYDPWSHSWSLGGALIVARVGHVATLLASGKVLVVGGSGSTGTLASAELYDPASGTWNAAGALGTGRRNHTATLLSSGKVLVVGGYNSNAGYLSSSELYDPASNTWRTTGALPAARQGHTATLLHSGRVLVVGGANSTGAPISSAALYDPVSGTWSAAGAPGTPRNQTTVTLLSSGQVLMAGGYNNGQLASAELYDPASNTWRPAGSLSTARTFPIATLLPSGQVLMAGGVGSIGVLSDAELYDPVSETWSAADALIDARWHHTATLLLSGEVLMVGGSNSSTLASAELADPGLSPDPDRRPTLDTVNSFLLESSQLAATSPGSNTDASGAILATGFMPLLEASGGGARNSASNAPVFQVQRIDNGQMRFIPNDGTVNITDTTFTGSATAFDGFPTGPILVRAWVNGVPSAARASVLAVTPGVVIAPTATGGVGQASVTFTAPLSDGGAPITTYTATATPGDATATCNAPCTEITFDPIAVGNYTFTIVATNAAGEGPASAPSNSVEVTPSATLSITVTGDGTVSAGATPAPVDGGIVDCDSSGGSNCVAVYAQGDIVTLDATPATGQHVTFGGDCASNGTVTMDTDHTCSAAFSPNTHTISGSVDQLSGSGLVLHLDYGTGTEDVSPASGDTSFAFTSAVPYGADYVVSVDAQPTGVSQTCTVSNGSGTLPDNDVTDVSVSCVTNTYTIGGAVTGLTGTGLILRLNGANDLPVNGSSFTFATPLPSGSSYTVTLATQPSDQICTLANATGTVTNANITDVIVDCMDTQPTLTLTIDDGQAFARYGQALDYLVTLSNSGNATASNVSVTSILSTGLDSANAQWQCTETTGGATCTASGTGALADTVVLPAGSSVTWIETVAVLSDASGEAVQMDVEATDATSVSDIDTLVTFRNGFDTDDDNGAPTVQRASISEAVLTRDVSETFELPSALAERVQTVLLIRSVEIEIAVERIVLGAGDYVRLRQHPTSGEDRFSAWVPVAGDAILSIASVAGSGDRRTVLLEGAMRPITLPLMTH